MTLQFNSNKISPTTATATATAVAKGYAFVGMLKKLFMSPPHAFPHMQYAHTLEKVPAEIGATSGEDRHALCSLDVSPLPSSNDCDTSHEVQHRKKAAFAYLPRSAEDDRDFILQYLHANPSLKLLDAVFGYHILDPHRRIRELRAAGHKIYTNRILCDTSPGEFITVFQLYKPWDSPSYTWDAKRHPKFVAMLAQRLLDTGFTYDVKKMTPLEQHELNLFFLKADVDDVLDR